MFPTGQSQRPRLYAPSGVRSLAITASQRLALFRGTRWQSTQGQDGKMKPLVDRRGHGHYGEYLGTLLPLLTILQLTYVLKRDSATDITITQVFITPAIMLEVY